MIFIMIGQVQISLVCNFDMDDTNTLDQMSIDSLTGLLGTHYHLAALNSEASNCKILGVPDFSGCQDIQKEILGRKCSVIKY